MKYTGTIQIVNEDGESIFDRELSADEMIEILAEEAGLFEEEAPVPSPVPPPAKVVGKKKEKKERKQYKKRDGKLTEEDRGRCVARLAAGEKVKDLAAEYGVSTASIYNWRAAGYGKEYGGRVEVTGPTSLAPVSVPSEDTGEEQDPLSFYEFGIVKRHQEGGVSVQGAADDLGVVPQEVQFAFDSTIYDEYLQKRS